MRWAWPFTSRDGQIHVYTSLIIAPSTIIAGLVARLNEELLAAGRPPLGFLNPLL
jgi:hypothetical protein